MKKSGWITVVLAISFWTFPAVEANALLGEGGTPEDYRPGKTNPVSNPARWCLMAEDQLGAATHNDTQKMMMYWNAPTDDNLSDWKMVAGNNYYSQPKCNIPSGPVAMAKGRVLTVLRDHAFLAFYTNDGSFVKPVVGGYYCMNHPDACFYTIPGTYYRGIPAETFSTIEIATGDIDGEVSKNGDRLDEIVVAYRKKNAGSGYSVWITALKANGGDSFTVLDSIQTNDQVVDSNYSFMSLTTGDYDNDGKAEIAVDYPVDDNLYYHLCTFDYEKGKLVQKDKLEDYLGSAGDYNQVDLTSGDFDGDGPDEIAATFGRCTTNNHDDTTIVSNWINIYQMDENLKISRKSTYCGSGKDVTSNKGSAITSGLFIYDPDPPKPSDPVYSIARRQLALIHMKQWKTGTWEPYIRTFDVDTDFNVTCISAIGGRGSAGEYPDKWWVACLKPEITAGRFLTLGNISVYDEIAASWGHTPQHGLNSEMIFNIFEAGNGILSIPGYDQTGYGFASKHSNINYSVYNITSVPIVAACTQEGKSYYLGLPAHIVVPKIISSIRVIQEPPKHLDLLQDGDGKWEVVNVSRTREFYAALKDVVNTSLTTIKKNQTNFDIGGSEKFTAKQTFRQGPEMNEAKVSTTESEKISYDYNSVTKKLNGNYDSLTVTTEFSTDRDDYLQLNAQLMDIWRYPVYGLKTQNGKNAFYEVVLPGPYVNMYGWGCDFADYYQPIHENGNLLSYPGLTDKDFPYDLGQFKVGDQDFQEAMTGNVSLTYGTGSGLFGVGWQDDTWDSKEISHTKKLNSNFDFKMGVKGGVNFLGWTDKESLKLALSFHVDKSWSNTSYSESKTSESKGITINLPSDAESQYAYTFEPLLYATKDGTLKLAHKAYPMGSTQGYWWTNHYQSQPDLSLNLPKKFWWDPNKTDPKYHGTWYAGKNRQLRSRMRGIFLLSNEPSVANKGKEQYLAGSATAGDTIYVQTYVYNYSLNTNTGQTGPFTVRFSYAPYDADLGDDPPQLTTIGEVGVDNLVAQERKEVYVKWDIAKDLGGNEPGAGKKYVIYVTLDPYNDVTNEIHELYVEDQIPQPSGGCPVGKDANGNVIYSAECGISCASNNQGYWPWTNPFMIFCPKEEEEEETTIPLDLTFKDESLEIWHTPQSEALGDWVFTDMEYILRVVIEANLADQDFREVLFYDNDKIFSMKRSFGLNPGENDFYCRWTPEEPGEHTLKVLISEDEEDPIPGNNTISLDVEVLDIKLPPRR